MRLKILLIVIPLFCFSKFSFSQVDFSFFVGADYGTTYFANKMADNIDFIRNNVSEYSIYNSSHTNNNNGINSRFDSKHFSLTGEFMFFDNIVGVGTGLRYSKFSCSLGDKGETEQYYYLKMMESSTNSNYLKIFSIDQTINNIGIPIEIRFIPYRDNNVRLYFKLSYEINVNFNSSLDVDFVNDAMEVYENQVQDLFVKPTRFSSIFTPSIGMRFWNEDNSPEIGFEMGCSYFSNSNVSSLVDAMAGFSMQVNVKMPLNIE